MTNRSLQCLRPSVPDDPLALPVLSFYSIQTKMPTPVFSKTAGLLWWAAAAREARLSSFCPYRASWTEALSQGQGSLSSRIHSTDMPRLVPHFNKAPALPLKFLFCGNRNGHFCTAQSLDKGNFSCDFFLINLGFQLYSQSSSAASAAQSGLCRSKNCEELPRPRG